MAESSQEPKKNSMMTIVLIGMFSFMITIVVAGTFLFLKFKDSQRPVATVRSGEIGPLVSVGSEIIVNLADMNSEHFLKANISLEADTSKTSQELSKRIPQIRDLIIGILSTKAKEKIDQKEGKEQIRREITNAINLHLSQGKVVNIYFQDFVIQ